MGTLPLTTRTLKDGTQITLRSADEHDAQATHEFRLENTKTAPYTATSPSEVPPEAEQRKMIAGLKANPCELLLIAEHETRAGRSIIGMLGLRSPGRLRLNHCVDLGMGVADQWRGRGVGRVLMTAALDWAAANPQIEKVTLGVIPENTPAVKLYESLGFVTEGVQRGQFSYADGQRLDHAFMGIWVKPDLAPEGHRMHRGAGAATTPPGSR